MDNFSKELNVKELKAAIEASFNNYKLVLENTYKAAMQEINDYTTEKIKVIRYGDLEYIYNVLLRYETSNPCLPQYLSSIEDFDVVEYILDRKRKEFHKNKEKALLNKKRNEIQDSIASLSATIEDLTAQLTKQKDNLVEINNTLLDLNEEN